MRYEVSADMRYEAFPDMRYTPGVRNNILLDTRYKATTVMVYRTVSSGLFATSKCCSKTYFNFFLCVFLFLITVGAEACKFPKYLERNAMWMTHNEKGNRLQGYFKENIFKASRCNPEGGNCVQSMIKCLNKREDNKFQVQHNIKQNEPPTFSCMQIIRRSDNIIQIRESQQQHYRSPNACNNEHLILDNWPMTNPENFDKQIIPCPFSGGYNVRFHTSDKQPLCATEIIPTRLESECEAGDGMTIKFPSENCIKSSLGMQLNQELYCAASWVHGNNTFLVVRPQNDEYRLWCMRFRGTNLEYNIEHAEIFIDIVCDPGDGHGNLRETSNYLNIEFEKRVISSTCSDSYSFCDDKRLCNEKAYSVNCRKVCGLCNGMQNQCNFPPSLEGEWIEHKEHGRGEAETVVVNTYSLMVSNRDRFTCNEQDPDHDFVNNTLLLQTFDNGCFPRYSCFEVRKSFSSILEYRIGNRVSWPVENWDSIKDDVCEETMFSANIKDKTVYGKSIKEKPMKILVDSKYHYHIDCGFKNWVGFDLNSVYLQEVGTENGCDICLVHNHAKHHDSIITQSLNCSSPPNHQMHYHCLGVFPQDETTHAIVTRKLHQHQEYRCWVFVDGHQWTHLAGIVYVLEATFCSSVAIESLKEGNLQPLKTYYIPKEPPSPCPYIQTDRRPIPPRTKSSTRLPVEEVEPYTRPRPIYTEPPRGPEESRNVPMPSYDPNRSPPTDSPRTDNQVSASESIWGSRHLSVYQMFFLLHILIFSL